MSLEPARTGAAEPVSGPDLFAPLCAAARHALRADGVAVLRTLGRTLELVHAEPVWAGTTVAPDLAAAVRTTPDGRLLRSVSSVPIRVHGLLRGVLHLARLRAAPWTPSDLVTARLFADAAGAFLRLADERDGWQQAWREAEHTATHDHLTGLPGRGLLFDRLDHAIATGARHGRAVAVLFVDVDDFKTVNDALGHAAGDATLVEVAHRLALTLRANDTLARLSGDEFVIVCEDLDPAGGRAHQWLSRLGERILLELRRPARAGETEIGVSVSIGAAVTTRECSAQSLTSQADLAMYAAKNSGGARVVVSRAQRAPRRNG